MFTNLHSFLLSTSKLVDNIVSIYRKPRGFLATTPLIHEDCIGVTDDQDVRLERPVSTLAVKAPFAAPTAVVKLDGEYVNKTTVITQFEAVEARTVNSKAIYIPKADYYGVPKSVNSNHLRNIYASAASSIGRMVDYIFFKALWAAQRVVTDANRQGTDLGGTADGILTTVLTTSVATPDETNIKKLVSEVQDYWKTNMLTGGDFTDGIGYVWVVPMKLFSKLSTLYIASRQFQTTTDIKSMVAVASCITLDGLLCIGVDEALLWAGETGGTKPTGYHNTFLYKRDALHFMWKDMHAGALTLPTSVSQMYQDALAGALALRQTQENIALTKRVTALETLFNDGGGQFGIFREGTFDTSIAQDVTTQMSDLVFKMIAAAGCARLHPEKIARIQIADANYPAAFSTMGVEEMPSRYSK